MPKKNINIIKLSIIIIILFSLLVRIYFFSKLTFAGTGPGSDSAHYMRLGKNLIEYGRYSFVENFNRGILFPPTYPFFIGVLNLLVGDLYLSGKLISLIFSLFSMFLFYSIGKKIFNKEAGVFSLLCFSVYPGIIFTSVLVSSESIFFFFFFLSVYIFLFWQKQFSFNLAIFYGITSAITYLARPEGFILIILPFFFAIKKVFRNKRILYGLLIILLIFIFITSPYIRFISHSIGKFSLSGKTNYNFIRGGSVIGENYEKIRHILNDRKDQLNIYDELKQLSIFDYIKRNPSDFTKRYFFNISFLFENLIIFLSPILLPFFFALVNKNILKNIVVKFLIFFSLSFFLIFPLFPIQRRYVYPLIPPLIIISASSFKSYIPLPSFLSNLFKLINEKVIIFFKNRIKLFMILLLIFCSVILNIKLQPYRLEKIPIEHINCGLYLKRFSSGYESINIMSREPWVSFYSDAKYTELPCAECNDLVHFAKIYKVDYIVIDERYLSQCEERNKLFELDKYSNQLELIYECNSPKLIKVFKFRIHVKDMSVHSGKNPLIKSNHQRESFEGMRN